ncbi:hypothetical protein [Methanolobus sp. WCC5]
MQKCEICNKFVDDLVVIRGKKMCKECISELQNEELDTENLDFGACI